MGAHFLPYPHCNQRPDPSLLCVLKGKGRWLEILWRDNSLRVDSLYGREPLPDDRFCIRTARWY